MQGDNGNCPFRPRWHSTISAKHSAQIATLPHQTSSPFASSSLCAPWGADSDEAERPLLAGATVELVAHTAAAAPKSPNKIDNPQQCRLLAHGPKQIENPAAAERHRERVVQRRNAVSKETCG